MVTLVCDLESNHTFIDDRDGGNTYMPESSTFVEVFLETRQLQKVLFDEGTNFIETHQFDGSTIDMLTHTDSFSFRLISLV